MISIFKYCKEPKAKPIRNLSEQEFFDGVKNGQWQDEVLNYRIGVIEKTKLHCLTPSGVFSQREIKGLVQHSNVICLDVDAKDQICEFDIEEIKKDDYVNVVHESCTGNGGYAIYVKIDGNKHLDAYLGLEEYFFVNYSIVLDKACKDVSRLRFVSFDPYLFQNNKSKVFKKYLKKKEVQTKQHKTIVVKSDFDEMVNQASSMNLFDDYNDYISLCFALVSEFGEVGRNYFHSLCSSSSKYNYEKSDRHYSQALKREKTGITISSVYFKFKENGIKLTSEKTEHIKSIIKLADNPTEVLRELNIKDDENLVEKFKNNSNEEKTEIDLIIDLIKLSKVRFNEVSRNFEFGKEEMTDRILAKFYTQVWTKIDDKISKDKIFTLIQNVDNSESYNPIHKWFDDNKHIDAKGNFEELTKCFEIESIIYEEKEKINITDYLDVYLKKWMLGLIGSAYGTYSLMILVLSGEQGIKKTEFFRNLFPEDLKKFYAESNLDEGKDSEILMTKKWLIVDDEFGGKSKKDATKLKRLSSQQKFSIRMPFGKVSEDLNRLAVLGGTSNDYEVINDPTGNRRIIPINLISFDFERYQKINKTKLFIELYKEWEQDKTGWFLTKGEIEYLNKSTTKNTEIMSEQELIDRNVRYDPYNKMTNTDIKLELEKLFPSLRTSTKRIGQALKICGYEQKIQKVDGKTIRFYECIFI
jgi:predicted P-loop ATPase